MNVVILLFLAGIILFGFEVFLPGMVAGTIGVIALVAGCVYSYMQWGLGAGLTAFGVAVALILLTLVVEFVWLPRTRFGKKFFLTASVSGASQAPVDGGVNLVGQQAVALTTLAPTGFVSVGGKQYEAFSQSGLVSAGTALQVVGKDTFRIIVSKI